MEDSLKQIEDSIIASNKSAIEHLKKEKYDHAMFFLNQALLTAKSLKDSQQKYNLLAMTYNNLGCYLKRLKKPLQALEYFTKSCEISKLCESNTANLTCSHLNISKIYSEQDDHEKALRHALKSLFLLRHNFVQNKTLVSSLVIAYQAVGIEYQYLKQIKDSKECYETGLNLSMNHLGKNHEVTLALKANLREVNGSARSQSHQSKKRNHLRGKSAGITKVGSNSDITKHMPASAKGRERERMPKTLNKAFEHKIYMPIEERKYKYNLGHIKAAVIIQKWWKGLFRKLRRIKNNAAVRIQKWWRGIRGRKFVEKIKVRNRICKRYVIRNPRVQNPSGGSFCHPVTKNIVNERERRLMIDSTKLLEDIQKDEPRPGQHMSKSEKNPSAHGGIIKNVPKENNFTKPNPSVKHQNNVENQSTDLQNPMSEANKLATLKKSQNSRPATESNTRYRSESASKNSKIDSSNESLMNESSRNSSESRPQRPPSQSSHNRDQSYYDRRRNSNNQKPIKDPQIIQKSPLAEIPEKRPVHASRMGKDSLKEKETLCSPKEDEKNPAAIEKPPFSKIKAQEAPVKPNSTREYTPTKDISPIKPLETNKNQSSSVFNSLESSKIPEFSPYSTINTSSSAKKPALEAIKPKNPQILLENKLSATNTPPITNKRNFLEGKRADITHQINSLVKIQSFIRMVVPRLRYIKLKKATICIQKRYKGHLIRKLYQAIRDAIIFIQFMYRKYKSKTKM